MADRSIINQAQEIGPVDFVPSGTRTVADSMYDTQKQKKNSHEEI
jgi:hypothetical protein